MIEQERFCEVRTHFYHDASSYDMFGDRRVVEGGTHWPLLRPQFLWVNDLPKKKQRKSQMHLHLCRCSVTALDLSGSGSDETMEAY